MKSQGKPIKINDMGIFSFLFRRKGVSSVKKETETMQVESIEPAASKRDYKSAPGCYKPKSNFVRLDGVARAAGVPYKFAKMAVIQCNIELNWRHGKCFINKTDAIKLHSFLWNEKA